MIGLNQDTLSAIHMESIHAESKHGSDKVLTCKTMPVSDKLSALGEEFGEVCRQFTYDTCNILDEDWRNHTVKELIQLANLAAAWAESIDHGGL